MWILIFAKFPEPGRVNTRLCPPLVASEAADLHTLCLRYVVRRARSTSADWVVLVGTPDERGEEFQGFLDTPLEFWPQGEGCLGQRLTRASARAFDQGASALVIVGTDSPTMDWGIIDTIPTILSNSDVVVGPCRDGGYYLVSLRDHHPIIFDGIDWGSDRVLEQTRRQAAEAGLRLTELATGYDVDRPEDLTAVLSDLERSDPEAELTAWLRDWLDRKYEVNVKMETRSDMVNRFRTGAAQ